MYECHLQVVYYFINFQLADTQFPSLVPFGRHFFWGGGCYADVGGNKIIFAGNQRTPADITVLKIKRYGTRLTQGYNWYGGSG